MTTTTKPITGMNRTNRLLAICLMFLELERRARFQHRQPLAHWARLMYERYRARLDRARTGAPDVAARSYRPARKTGGRDDAAGREVTTNERMA